MKKKFFIISIPFILFQCQEEKPALQRAAQLKCECLKTFDPAAGNLMDVLNCSDEISTRVEFADLNPIEVSDEMEKICPNISLPFDQIQQ